MLISFANLQSNELIQITKYWTISGVVKSEESSEPLRSVSVRIVDSPRGTFTNAKGEFTLKLEEGSHQIIFSMVGMERRILDINLFEDVRNIKIELKTSSAMVEGVIVIAEDPGKRMMRRAIQRRLEQAKNLKSYKYLLYTKFITATDTLTAGRTDTPTDTTVISIFESYSIGYFRQPNQYYNEIIQRRQSVNVAPQSNFVAFGTNLNIYDNFVNILGEEIYSPFHEDAADFYDFILDTNFRSDYYPRGGRIIVTPDSRNRRLFSGYINLDPEALIPISVELYPNEVVRLPFNTKITIEQTFLLYDNLFLMPERLDIRTTSSANIFGIVNPRLDISLSTYATNFEFNIPLENRLFNNRRVEAARSADRFDERFWEEKSLIPLSASELEAYEFIRRAREAPDSVSGTTFFDLYFAPISRQLAKLNRKPFTGLRDMFIYNRVQGVNLNIPIRDAFLENYDYQAVLGYSFANKRINYLGSFKVGFDELKQYSIDLSYYDKLQRIDDPFIIQTPAITWTSLFLGSDYGDYYYSRGGEIGLQSSFGQQRFIRRDVFERPRTYRIYFRSEQHRTARNSTGFSIIGRDRFRENPPIVEGLMNSVGFDINWNFHRQRRLSNLGFYLGGEFTSPEIFSDFEFARLQAMMNLRTKTMPLWRLDMRISGGYSFGNLPSQKFFTLRICQLFNIC